jgi:hypothetical protein
VTLIGCQRGEPAAAVAGTPNGAVLGGHSNGSEDAHGHDGSPPQAGDQDGKTRGEATPETRHPPRDRCRCEEAEDSPRAKIRPARPARSGSTEVGHRVTQGGNTASQIKRGASALKLSKTNRTAGRRRAVLLRTAFPGPQLTGYNVALYS